MEARIRDVVDRLLRPLVTADGGTIEVTRLEDGVVTIRLGGTCSGCPGAPFTRSRVVERALRSLVAPDIRVEFEQSASVPPRTRSSSSPGTEPAVSDADVEAPAGRETAAS